MSETNLSKIIHNMKLKQTKMYNNIVCAGGIIYDTNKHKVLVVQGIEKWSLPKGHREPGEELHETAIREIYEETSLKVNINESCHSKWILKSIYYLIIATKIDDKQLFPIDTKEIICVKWCNKEQLFSMDCNKQLKYLVRKWDSIIGQFYKNTNADKFSLLK